MQVNTPVISLELPRQLPATVRGWMLGQVLDAVVIGRDSQNSIRMNVAGTEVRAATSLPLRSGDTLSLRVSQLQPVITLTAATPASTAGAANPEQLVLRGAVNQALPQQQALAKSFDQLARLVDSAPATTSASAARTPLPAPVTQIAARLLAALPRYADVSDPVRLPGILQRLGNFAESTLAKSTQAQGSLAAEPARDLKLQLLQLRAELEGTAQLAARATQRRAAEIPASLPAGNRAVPGAAEVNPRTIAPGAEDTADDVDSLRQLARIVEGAIAKIETNQLKTIAAWFDGDAQLHFDLPVLFDDGHRDLRLQVFSEEAAAPTSAAESDTIVLEIPLDDGKSLRAAVTLAGDDLSVRLWSDDAAVRAIVAQRRDELTHSLRANGLENVAISLVELKPFDDWSRKFSQLVDTTA